VEIKISHSAYRLTIGSQHKYDKSPPESSVVRVTMTHFKFYDPNYISGTAIKPE